MDLHIAQKGFMSSEKVKKMSRAANDLFSSQSSFYLINHSLMETDNLTIEELDTQRNNWTAALNLAWWRDHPNSPAAPQTTRCAKCRHQNPPKVLKKSLAKGVWSPVGRPLLSDQRTCRRSALADRRHTAERHNSVPHTRMHHFIYCIFACLYTQRA